MKIGFYPGSFDPFTNGHLHVIEKTSILFDKVIVGIGVHPTKKRSFNKELMKKAIEKVLIRKQLDNVEVMFYENFSADIAIKNNATFLVRGIRNGMDYEYEENIAAINEETVGIDTVYIRSGKLGNISSSMVMELLKYDKDVTKYVPEEILDIIKKN